MDLLELYQLRMDKCAAEQFWSMAMFASMSGFVILKNKTLVQAMGTKLLKWGIALACVFCQGYIASRHFIYMHYDFLANQLVAQQAGASSSPPPAAGGLRKTGALWSGVIFYSAVIVGMTVVSFMTTLKGKAGLREKA